MSAVAAAGGLLVIDASLFVQLIVEEPQTASIARYLSEEHRTDRFIAPSILASETAAAITRKLRRREIGPQSAREAFESLQQALADGSFELLPANDFLQPAFELSLKLHHSLHDCMYLAVARIQRALLVTVDQTLAGKAQAAGVQSRLVRADR